MSCSSNTFPPLPADAIRHNNLGVALMDVGVKDPKYFPEAIKEFEAGLQSSPKYQTARINLGMAFYYAGQTEKCLSILESLAREAPDNLYVNYMLGLLKEMNGNFKDARMHFQKVTQQDPQDPNSWYHLGYCYSKERQYQEAVEPFRKAAAISPYQRRLRYNLYMALNRAGKAAEAEVELENFKKLEASSVRVVEASKTVMEYLKQGKYAEAIAESRTISPPAQSGSHYTDVAPQLGLHFQHAGTSQDSEIRKILQGDGWPRTWFTDGGNQRKLVAALGTGAAFCDYNKDGRLDVFLVNVNGIALYEQKADGQFEDVTRKAGLDNKPLRGMACAWGDYDNDGWADLLISGYGQVRLYRNNKGRFQDVTGTSGISKSTSPTTWCMGAAFADVDHDGDLDIYVTCFVDLNELPEKTKVRFPDDFHGQPNLLFRNNSNGTFTEIAKQAHADGGLHLTRNVWFADVNDDRAIDLVLFDSQGKPATFLNNKDGTFSPSNLVPAILPEPLPPGESRAAGDFNGDGAVDEVILKNGSPAVLNRNDSKPANWLSVRLEGYALPGKVKSNTLGIGTKVEVRSVGKWERKEVRAGNGEMGCDAPQVYFDLGDQTRVDFVRAVFPSGVRWTLKDVASNQTITIAEPLLDVNSCPALFTWNGERFEFIADTLSAGILGELVAPQQYWRPDPDEWLRITEHQLQPSRQNTFDLRFANPLEEVTYLDQVKLLAVDHPAGVEVYPNERMVNDPKNRKPIQLYGLANLRPVARALDQHGQDVTKTVAEVDRHYFDHFNLLPFKGFAENWSLTLDLGLLGRNAKPVLLLQSWSYWNSSAAIVAAAQANETLWGPVLEVLGKDGQWHMGIEDMGVAAGLPRTMVVDLSGVLEEGEHIVRVRSNRMLYYDQIRVADRVERLNLDGWKGEKLRIDLREMSLLSAQLHWLGYPKRILQDHQFPEVFDYSQIEQQADWGTHAGMLTRYGEVLPLLQPQDDQFVVMEHGEEVALSFDGNHLPALPSGWKRTFLFYSDGFSKGYEVHSGQSETVDLLPFHAMEPYPFDSDKYPIDEVHLRYLLDWNTRPSFMRK